MNCEEHAQSDWQRAHSELTRLAKSRAMHDAEEARWILVAVRTRTDRRLGFASMAEYLERLFGWSPRRAREKVRFAEALEALPKISRALAAGEIHWSCARELTRVAIDKTEHAWLEAARGASMREVEELVSGHAPGDMPGDPRDAKIEHHTIHARVSAETLALWREAIASVRRSSDGSLSRATQEIPPATRRFVLHRDHHRCVVPGCRNAIFVDVHHIHPKSEGGDHHPDRLITLCGAHHKQAHAGRLLIEGDCATGLVFKHADGTRYGQPIDAKTSSAASDVFSALRNLGFKHTESQQALSAIATHVGCAGFDSILRAALLYLRTGSSSIVPERTR